MDASGFSRIFELAPDTLIRGTITGIVGVIIIVSCLVFSESQWQTEAIERGYALHCPTTGEFAWKGECDN